MSKSSNKILEGGTPATKSTLGVNAILPGLLIFLKIEMVPGLEFVTTKSGLPSLSKSAAVTFVGFEPVAKITCEEKDILSAVEVFLTKPMALL